MGEKKEVPAADAEDLFGDVIFEQDPLQIINALLPLYLNGQVGGGGATTHTQPMHTGGGGSRAGVSRKQASGRAGVLLAVDPDTPTPVLCLCVPQVLRMLQESVASELGARMAAMQSASDNAEDLAGRLTVTYNRARQVGPRPRGEGREGEHSSWRRKFPPMDHELTRLAGRLVVAQTGCHHERDLRDRGRCLLGRRGQGRLLQGRHDRHAVMRRWW